MDDDDDRKKDDGQGAPAEDGDVEMDAGETPAADAVPPKKEVKLEDLFADVDSDEEFPSSAPVKHEDPSSSSPTSSPASPMFVTPVYPSSCPCVMLD